MVQSQDPERFAAVMTAPVDLRARLLVIFAFNLELARAGVVTGEPMIAEMRLQFWRDCLLAAENGEPPRAHEVAGPLMELAAGETFDFELAREMIDGRSVALDPDFPGDDAVFDRFLEGTGGALMALSGGLCEEGTSSRSALHEYGTAAAFGNLLRAAPKLEQSQKRVFVDGRPAALQSRAKISLDRVKRARMSLKNPVLAPVLRGAILAKHALELTARQPDLVASGGLEMSEFRKKLTLVRLVVSRSF